MDLLLIGSKGENVTLLQKSLQALGLYQGDLTNVFDMNTMQAVLKFQKMKNLPNDGVVSSIVFDAIKNESPSKISLPVEEKIPQNNTVTLENLTNDLPIMEESQLQMPPKPESYNESKEEEKKHIIPTEKMDPKSEQRYSVVYGDSLWKIAQRFGTNVDEIKKSNGLSKDSLTIGQILIVPNS